MREGSSDWRKLERVLDEGIDDLDAGRTVSREELHREVEALLSSQRKQAVHG
jgi:hypothetical protein